MTMTEEEEILGLELECEEDELSPAQIALHEANQAHYDRAMGLVQNWRKNKRKVLSYTTDGLQMYSAKPIVPKIPTSTPVKFISQNGPVITNIRQTVVSGATTTTGTILMPPTPYNSQFHGIVRQTRPIQISNNLGSSGGRAPPPLRPQSSSLVSQSPITIRSAPTHMTPGGGGGNTNTLPVQQLIFDSNSGLLLMPPQQQQQQQQQQQNMIGGINPRIPPNNVNVNTPTSTRANTRMIFPGVSPTTLPINNSNPIRRPGLPGQILTASTYINSNSMYNTSSTTTITTPPTTVSSISLVSSAPLKTYQTPKIVSSTSLNPGVNKAIVQHRQQPFPTKSSSINEHSTTKTMNVIGSGKSNESIKSATTNSNVGGSGGTGTVSNGLGGGGGTTINTPSSGTNTSENDPNNRTFPSLVVNVKPCLHDKPSKAKTGDARTDLDARVKALLIYQASKFTEWLMQRGLLKLEHKCTIHLNEEKEAIPYKLGMYSDGNKQPFSGGYVWISECCTDKQITVFQGSIFEASVYPPGTLLKLIYHWSCQTTATNVLMWVKVTSYYLKNFYTLLRSACVAALHELCPLMGGKSKFVEVGIITLGTTLSVQNGQKQVKVEILGVFDPTTKVIRMKVINPQNVGVTSASHSRVMQILWPLNHWVDKSSIILIDTSIEKSLLIEMGFKNVHQCKTNAPNTTQKSATPTNVNVMNYLKHVVPKMFQNTLCVLSKSLIQQFLDELSWRELWGETPATTFDTMINHLVQMTKWETGESLISRLNRISLNPFGEWSYSRGRSRTGIEMLPDSIRGSSVGNSIGSGHNDNMPELSVQPPILIGGSGGGGKTNGNIMHSSNSNISGGGGGGSGLSMINNRGKINRGGNSGNSIGSVSNKPPVLLPQVQQISNTTMSSLKRKIETPNNTMEFDLNRHYMTEPKTVILQSYYYAECLGNSCAPISNEFPTNLKCPLCSKLFISNQEVIRHIFMHVQSMGIRPSSLHGFCEYCLKDVGPVTTLQTHINEVHKMIDIPFACLICQEKFHSETNLTLHMWENHGKYEMPYKCETCEYKSSFQFDVVNHFNKEHCGTDSVLCPLCLKVLTAKSFTCMKQIVVHLQSHTIRKGKKCTQCTLTFNGDMEFRTHLYDNSHQNDDKTPIPTDRVPIPYKITNNTTSGNGIGNNFEIKMANPPKVKRIAIQTQMPPLKKVAKMDNNNSNNNSGLMSSSGIGIGNNIGNNMNKKSIPSAALRLQIQGDGTQYHFNELNIQFVNSKVNSTKCLECLKFTGNEDHFPGYMVCIKCRFATCCRISMINHNLNVHPNIGDIKLKSSFKIKNAESLEYMIYCGCGYGTKSGNKMARHLIGCEKTTALSELPPLDEDNNCEGGENKQDGLFKTSSPMPNLLDQLGLTRKE